MGSRNVAGMLTLLRFIVAVLVRRFRSRAVLELENLALRHQLHVLRRQRPGRPRLFAIDRLLWVLLYRSWPRCLEVMVLDHIVIFNERHLRRVLSSYGGITGRESGQSLSSARCVRVPW